MAKPYEIVNNGMSLTEFFRLYPSDIEAEEQLVAWRWPDGIRCPHCGSDRISDVKSRRPQPWRCKDCRRHFSHTTDTPMHDTKLGPQTWLLSLFLIVSNPKGRSSVQLAADLGITQKSAWHLAHRIRRALEAGDLPGFVGPVQVDETYVGGRVSNKHAWRKRSRTGSTHGKIPVMGFKDNYTGRVATTPVHCRHQGCRLSHGGSGRAPGRGGLHRRLQRLRQARGHGVRPREGHPHRRRVRPRGRHHERGRELLEWLEAVLRRHVPLVVGRPPPPIRRGARLPVQQPQPARRPPHGHGDSGDERAEAPMA